MISVTPLNRNVELAAKRATIIRTAAFSVAGLTAIVVAASRLANFTGDLLSSLVLVLTAVVTLMAMAAPREARHGHG
jgi:hypothetical protein